MGIAPPSIGVAARAVPPQGDPRRKRFRQVLVLQQPELDAVSTANANRISIFLMVVSMGVVSMDGFWS